MRDSLLERMKERLRERYWRLFLRDLEVNPEPEPIILPDDPVDD